MTPDRWRRIDELFAAALRIEPAERQAWLVAACGDDNRLRAEVARLLDQDERAGRDRLLAAPGPPGRPVDRTGSWHSHGGHSRSQRTGPIGRPGDGSGNSGFSPGAGARHEPSGSPELRDRIGGESQAARTAIDPRPHRGHGSLLEIHDPRRRRSAAPQPGYVGHRGPRHLVRPALESLARLARVAPGSGAGNDRNACHRRISAGAEVLTARGADDGAVNYEERRAPHRNLDPQFWFFASPRTDAVSHSWWDRSRCCRLRPCWSYTPSTRTQWPGLGVGGGQAKPHGSHGSALTP
jgi:hypothetical protein